MTVVRPDIKFTYAEYRALPETGPRYQLIEGYRLQEEADKPVRALGATDTLTTALLPGFSLDLATVFAA